MIDREKRDIRVVFGIFAALFWIVAYRSGLPLVRYACISAGVILLIVSLAAPRLLKPLFLLWMRFAHFMGRVNTQILLFIVFLVVMLPSGFLLRIFGRDPMQRKMSKEGSYWEPASVAGLKDRERYHRQF